MKRAWDGPHGISCFCTILLLWSHVPVYTIAHVGGSLDSCAAIADTLNANAAVPISNALACAHSFPYNASIAHAIVDTVRKVYHMYVYKDISKNSPTPELPLKVDIMKELDLARYSDQQH